MKRILFLLALLCLERSLHAQYVYTIKADSVKITNTCDTAELIIENHTQNVPGFLFNKGRGRTEFRRPLSRVSDSIYLVGIDTLRLSSAWLQGGNTFGTTGYFGTRDNNHVDFYTNSTQRMRLTNAGRLLLNTTTDNGYEFQLNGWFSLTDGVADIVSPRFRVLVGDELNAYGGSGFLFNGDVTARPILIGTENGNNFHKFYIQTAGQPNDTVGTYNFTYDGNKGPALNFYSFREGKTQLLLSGAGNLILGSTPDNTDKLQVSKNGAVTISGNLSRSTDRIQIGQLLNVNDGQNALIRTSNNGGSTYKNILVERDGYIGLGTSSKVGGWNVGNPALRIYDNGTVMVSSNPFFFGFPYGNYNSSALTMRVSNLNEWEIGSNYPNRANYYYFGTILGGADGANVRADLKIGGRNLRFLAGVGPSSDEGIEAVTITENLNMLIGTTTDDGNRLQVVGNSSLAGDVLIGGNINQAVNTTASFGNGLLFNQESNRSRIYSERGIKYQSNSAGDQHLFSNNIGAAFTGTLVTIDPGYYQLLPDNQLALNVYGKQFTPGLAVNMAGRVGVGTQTPTAQLHTTGTVRFGGLSSNNSLTRFLVSDANGNLYYREDSGSAFNGTYNSDLAINGRITAKQMIITQTGRWPDYVFSKQYQLPSLTEVESFINKNSHLPGIPSAAEVEKKGIDVGCNQAAQLKKIEELTLYIIQQDKELKSLKQEIEELKALIKGK